MVELRTRSTDRKSRCRSSSTYRHPGREERCRGTKCLRGARTKRSKSQSEPGPNWEPARQSKEPVYGNPRPTVKRAASSRRSPPREPKSRMCGPQVRFCERGPRETGGLYSADRLREQPRGAPFHTKALLKMTEMSLNLRME